MKNLLKNTLYISYYLTYFPTIHCLSLILYCLLWIIIPVPLAVSFHVSFLHLVYLIFFSNFEIFTWFCYSFSVLPLFFWTEKAYLFKSLNPIFEFLGTINIFLYFIFVRKQVASPSHVYGYLWVCYWHRIFKIVCGHYGRYER